MLTTSACTLQVEVGMVDTIMVDTVVDTTTMARYCCIGNLDSAAL